MKYKAIIECSTIEEIEADNISSAREQAEELADEIGAMDIGIDSIKVKRIKENKV